MGETIKPYKIKRLSFAFWNVWHNPTSTGKTDIQNLYTMVTTMVMQRFTQKELFAMLLSWRKRRVDAKQLSRIIESVKAYTLEERRRLKREEVRRYRAKKKRHVEWLDEMRSDMAAPEVRA